MEFVVNVYNWYISECIEIKLRALTAIPKQVRKNRIRKQDGTGRK